MSKGWSFEVLTESNKFYTSPLDAVIAEDNIKMFKQIDKHASSHGMEKQLLSLTNDEGKSVYQVAKSLSASKIQDYIISRQEAVSGQSQSELLTKSMEFGIAVTKIPALDKAPDSVNNGSGEYLTDQNTLVNMDFQQAVSIVA